jgi:hypothetical protein
MTRRILLPIALLALIAAFVPLAGADGGKAKNAVYQGEAQPRSGTGSVRFSIDTSPIIFYLGTVNNKYHVVLIRVMNKTDKPLTLSREQDTVELRFSHGTRVTGLLNLAATDHATWDGLEAEIRTAVAYPDLVPAKEEEGIYVFVPVDAVKDPRKAHEMPSEIDYTIRSLGSVVTLRSAAMAA